MRALMMTLGRWSLWRVLLLAFAWLGIVVMTWRLVIAPWLFRRWSRDMEAILSRIAAEHPDQAIGAISLGVPPLFFIILLVPPVALLTAWCVARLGWTANDGKAAYRVLVVQRNALAQRRLVADNRALRQDLQAHVNRFGEIIGRSPRMKQVFDLIIQAAPEPDDHPHQRRERHGQGAGGAGAAPELDAVGPRLHHRQPGALDLLLEYDWPAMYGSPKT